MIRRTLTFAGSFILCASMTVGAAAAAQKAASKAGDAAKGKQLFEQCAICHNVDTDEKKMGPSLKGLFKKKTMVTGKPVNDQNVLEQINNGGNGMPAYADMLSAQDKADILAYLHTI